MQKLTAVITSLTLACFGRPSTQSEKKMDDNCNDFLSRLDSAEKEMSSASDMSLFLLEDACKSKVSRRYSSWGRHRVDLRVRLDYDGVVTHNYVLDEKVVLNTPSGGTVAIPVEEGIGGPKKQVPVLSAIVDGENRKSQDERIIRELLGTRKSMRKQSASARVSGDKLGKLNGNSVMNENNVRTSTATIMADVFGRD